MLTMLVYFRLEAVCLRKIRFAKGFSEQAIAIEQTIVLLQFSSFNYIQVQFRGGFLVLARIEIDWIDVVDANKSH